MRASTVRPSTSIRVVAQLPRPPPPPASEKYQITISGPPSAAPPQVRLVENPLTAPGEVIKLAPSREQPATISVGRAQAREQAALLQARNEEVRQLREALLAEQVQRHSIQSQFVEVLGAKDKQLEAMYKIAAEASSERGLLRAEYMALANELRATQAQMHTYTQSLLQLQDMLHGRQDGSSGATDGSAGLEALLAAAGPIAGPAPAHAPVQPAPAAAAGASGGDSGDLTALLRQLHELSSVLVEDMQRDEEALAAQGLGGHAALSAGGNGNGNGAASGFGGGYGAGRTLYGTGNGTSHAGSNGTSHTSRNGGSQGSPNGGWF